MKFSLLSLLGCLLVCRDKANCPHVGPGPLGENALHRGLSKESQPIFKRVSEKTTENSERLGQQARSRIEPAPPVFQFEHIRAQPLVKLSLLGNFAFYQKGHLWKNNGQPQCTHSIWDLLHFLFMKEKNSCKICFSFFSFILQRKIKYCHYISKKFLVCFLSFNVSMAIFFIQNTYRIHFRKKLKKKSIH